MADTSYGSLAHAPLTHLSLDPKGGRNVRIEWTHLLSSVILPVGIFAATFAVLSFQLRYALWWFAWVIALALVLPAVYVWILCGRAFMRDGKNSADVKWLTFLASFCLLGWVAGIGMGMANYATNMVRYYDMAGLNYYPSVDPSKSGDAHIDGGRFMFEPGSTVQISRAMGVKVSDIYCVAPIINPNVPHDQRQYDYWAVGMGCCSAVQPQDKWNCGDVNNHNAVSGMRLMSDAPRPFYRMAVQEAEATYHLKAMHPIFVEWMVDPAATMASWRASGIRLYWEGVFSAVVIMLFLSASAGLYLTRTGSTTHDCKGTGFQKYVQANGYDFLEDGATPKITKRITT